MLSLTIEAISKALGYICHSTHQSEPIKGICTDSRHVKQGDLFIAIRGEKVDGHQYLQQAIVQGAAAVAISDARYVAELQACDHLLVEDGIIFIQRLGYLLRTMSAVSVVAVTGSSGKTTTKDLLSAILAEYTIVVATKSNHNNELGLPLTLCRIEADTKAVVVEMGMRGLGQIDFLCTLAAPDYGIITNIGKVHSELLGSQENIAQAKAELLMHLPPMGLAALNADDENFLAPFISHCACPVIWCSTEKGRGDAWAESIESLTYGTGFRFVWGDDWHDIRLNMEGLHNVQNALQALVIARRLGVSWECIDRALENTAFTKMRMERIILPNGAVVFNDAYNANPDSMKAALSVLAKQPGRRIAVLGDMYELGQYEEDSHREVGRDAILLGIDIVIAEGQLGKLIGQAAEAVMHNSQLVYYAADNQSAAELLSELLQNGDQVLIKGSRGMKMEEIVQIIMG